MYRSLQLRKLQLPTGHNGKKDLSLRRNVTYSEEYVLEALIEKDWTPMQYKPSQLSSA